jgi:hypothetical protein
MDLDSPIEPSVQFTEDVCLAFAECQSRVRLDEVTGQNTVTTVVIYRGNKDTWYSAMAWYSATRTRFILKGGHGSPQAQRCRRTEVGRIQLRDTRRRCARGRRRHVSFVVYRRHHRTGTQVTTHPPINFLPINLKGQVTVATPPSYDVSFLHESHDP